MLATVLRFFTVYGPWGRPDKVFNQGKLQRDFTYIDDIVERVIRCVDKPATADPNSIRSLPTPLLRFIELHEALGKEAIKEFQPMQLPMS